MSDLIDRKAAIDALAEHEKSRGHNYTLFVDIVSECAEIIRNLPSAQQWIPCSERLPKPFEHCLWTTTDGRVVYHHCDGLFSNYTAWMPLPEPYKEEENETD
jgi:hypothetical protein